MKEIRNDISVMKGKPQSAMTTSKAILLNEDDMFFGQRALLAPRSSTKPVLLKESLYYMEKCREQANRLGKEGAHREGFCRKRETTGMIFC